MRYTRKFIPFLLSLLLVACSMVASRLSNISGLGGGGAAPRGVTGPPMPRPPASAASTPIPVPGPAAPVAPQNETPPAITKLVDRITEAASLNDASGAVQEVLAMGGVATIDADAGMRTADAPAAPVMISPREIVLLAREARQRGAPARLSADQLGHALRDLGFRFEAGATPGEHIVRFLSARIGAAQSAPADPRSFTWLFLFEMGDRKWPPVDLASGTAKPAALGFNMLELELFAAALLRGAPRPPSPANIPAVRPQVASLQTVTDDGLASRAPGGSTRFLAQAGSKPPPPADACTALLDRLMPPRPGSEAARAFGDDLFGTAAKEVIEELLGLPLSKADRKQFGDAVDALNIFLRAQKLVALGSWTELTVSATATSVHKPEKDASPELVVFTARAGVNEAEWAALQRIGERLPGINRFDNNFKDCMALIGPGMYTDIEALAQEAETWNVAWELRPRDSPHVQIKLGGTHPAKDENVFDFPGLRQSRLKRVSGASAATEFKLLVLPETVNDHRGRKKTAYVDVCALLKTEKRPSSGVLVDAAGGGIGLASAIFDLTTAFWRTFDPRTACTTLEVTYHERFPDYRVYASGYVTRGLDGTLTEELKCGGPGGEWKIHAEVRSLGVVVIEENAILRLDEQTMEGTVEGKFVWTMGDTTCTATGSGRVLADELREFRRNGPVVFWPYVDDGLWVGTGHPGYQGVVHCTSPTGASTHKLDSVYFTVLEAGNFCGR